MTKLFGAKSLISALTVALVFMLLGAAVVAVPTSAAGGDGEIVFGEGRARAGETVSVDIFIENNPGVAVLSVTLDYDTSALALIEVENGTIFSNLDAARNLFFSSDINRTGDGALATLTFEVNEDAEAKDYTVSAVVNEAYNEDFAFVPLALSAGTVTVYDFIYDLLLFCCSST